MAGGARLGGSSAPLEDRDRDLVTAIRAELAAIEPARACCRRAERAGLGDAASGRARSPVVARLAVRLTPSAEGPPFDWSTARNHCRLAYLRGRFLARGSLSLASGRTHLEFVVDPDMAPVLAAQLAEVGLPAARRLRRGRGVVTWKSTEAVLAFLRRIGGSSAVLEVESRLVTRSLRGHLNRVLNAEGANLSRSVATASRHLSAIDRLEASGELARLPATSRQVAGLRRDAPEATLSELAERLGLSRTRVQRALERLEEAAESAETEAEARGVR
jgi:DNA-binding transcriptional regulator WhiA